jgi:hypothetical protein
MTKKNFFAQCPFFKRTFPLALTLFVVLGALVFTGCPQEGGGGATSLVSLTSDSPLIGTWEMAYESYTIAAQTIKYDSTMSDDYSFEAKIHGVKYFTGERNSGMLYIEYTSKRPKYFSYGGAPDYPQTGGPFDPPGNFTVVMFNNLNTSGGTMTIKLANPYNPSDTYTGTGTNGSQVTYNASEVRSLDAATEKFGIDTVQNFVDWSNVQPQTKK